MTISIDEKLADRKGLLAEMQSIAWNSEERMKAIEVRRYFSEIFDGICRVLESRKITRTSFVLRKSIGKSQTVQINSRSGKISFFLSFLQRNVSLL